MRNVNWDKENLQWSAVAEPVTGGVIDGHGDVVLLMQTVKQVGKGAFGVNGHILSAVGLWKKRNHGVLHEIVRICKQNAKHWEVSSSFRILYTENRFVANYSEKNGKKVIGKKGQIL